jgi:CHAT domain-containing protein/tetratricopeptide (TPR) repeat protein
MKAWRAVWPGCVWAAAVLPSCTSADADPPVSVDDEAAPVPPAYVYPATVDGLIALGDSLYDLGEFGHARDAFLRLVPLARESGDPRAEAQGLMRASHAENRLGNYDSALRLGQESLDLRLTHGISDRLAASYNALGMFAYYVNRFEQAELHLSEAMRWARETGDRRAEVVARGNLAMVQMEVGRFKDAREGYQGQIDFMRESAGDEVALGNALTNLGELETRLGDPQVAVATYHEALAAYRTAGSAYSESYARGHLAIAYAALGEHDRAFATLDTALAQVRAAGMRQEEASNLEAMAEQHREAGDFRRALDLYRLAKEINEELGLTLETGQDLRGEAEIHLALRAPEQALPLAEEALRLHRQVEADPEVLQDHLVLAEVNSSLERSPGVIRHLDEADLLAQRLSVRSSRVAVALTRARLAARAGDPNAVLEALAPIWDDLPRGGYAQEWEAHLLAASAYAHVPSPDMALASGWRALETVERVKGSYGATALGASFGHDKRAVYDQMVEMLIRFGHSEDAFRVSDLARARLVARSESPSTASTSSGTSAVTRALAEIDRLVESIEMLEGSARPEARSAADLDELDRLYSLLRDRRNDFEGLVARRGGGNEVNETASELGIGVQDVQRSLAEGEALVAFFVPDSGSVRAFALTGSTFRLVETRLDAQGLPSRLRVARERIARADPGAAQSTLRGLHEALVGPLVSAGSLDGVRRLVVIPHGALTYLPFAALRDPATGRFLIEDYELGVFPSVHAFTALGTRGSPTDGSALTVFAPVPDDLPATRAEALAVSQKVPGARVVVGSEATEAAVRRALADGAPIHLATHGIMNTSNPLFSRVVLARGGDDSEDDGRLETHELLELSSSSPLVFLSACETGVGRSWSTRFDQGADYATLTTGFLGAGVGNVIATLWPVDDDGSAVFAERFYAALGASSPSTALVAAQRAMIADEQFAAPYYWAGYQHLGSGRPVAMAQDSPGPP